MSLELFEVIPKGSEEKLPCVSLRSLLDELRVLNVNNNRDEKLVLSSLERALMVLNGELEYPKELEKQEEAPEVPTPPEPPAAIPKPEAEPEVPVPVKEEHKAKKIDLAEDEFPLRM